MSKLRIALWMGLALSVLLLGGCSEDSGTKVIESESAPPVESEAVPEREPPAESEAVSETEPPAPKISFKGTDLDGNTVSSDMFSQSRLTMINVWATYCNPCLREMPDLGELAAEYDPADFQLIGIVSDVMEGEDQSLAEDLVQQTGANYPHLLVNDSIYYTFLTSVSGVPTTFFVDQDGRALGYIVGANEKSVWEELINGLLEEQ